MGMDDAKYFMVQNKGWCDRNGETNSRKFARGFSLYAASTVKWMLHLQ